MLAQMRAKGFLTFSASPPSDKNGLLDVYNYAARYRCIPSVIIRQSHGFYTIHIDMPEHGIRVRIINAPSVSLGENAAAREFKRQAELYHLSKGDENVDQSHQYALGTHNAHEFFDFARDSGEISGVPDVRFKMDRQLWVAEARLEQLGLDSDMEIKVSARNKSHLLKAAYLVTALSVIKLKPHLFDMFTNALCSGHGKYVPQPSPRDVVLHNSVMRELDLIRKNLDLPDQVAESCSATAQSESYVPPQVRLKRSLTPAQLAMKSSRLRRSLEDYKARRDLEGLRQARAELPMAQHSSRVRQMVHENVYCVIVGATGSGKTTQVPQILLDEAIENGNGASCNVICTQPRRIAAKSVAQRVAAERAEQLGQTVGYQVRFDAKPPRHGGSILYCTTGVLLQRLQNAPDDVLDHVSHLVIDEVHERDVTMDYLFITLKATMAARAAQGKNLPRVVLMSATIDPEQFAAYFRNSLPFPSGTSNGCPALTVPGRTFPVQKHYLEDILGTMRAGYDQSKLGLLHKDEDTVQYLKAENIGMDGTPRHADSSINPVIDRVNQATGAAENVSGDADDALVPLGLAATTVSHIVKTSKSGAILVFLPGLKEITQMDKLLRTEYPLGVNFSVAQKFQIIMLHSSIEDSQKTVFDPVPEGCRKIILSTNIAETSVTIPDVQYVVDTGKSREKRYDQVRRITELQCRWASKSNVQQRAGRAGRVQNGSYYALFTRSRQESLRALELPELLRSDLQEICLDIKTQAFKTPVAEFLAGAMEPPPPRAVEIAMENLTSLGAITQEEELTSLGRLLASLPVHPTLGKMIVMGIIFRCLDPMIILGVAAGDRPFFVSSVENRGSRDKFRKRLAGRSRSDHLTLLTAFRTARSRSGSERYALLRDSFISPGAFNNIDGTAREILGILREAGHIRDENTDVEPTLQYGGTWLNQNSGSHALIKALLLAGLYPNLAATNEPGRKLGQMRTATEKFISMHPASVNAGLKLAGSGQFFTFSSLALASDGRNLFIRDTSSVTPLMALLFGGHIVQRGPVLELDNWLPMSIKTSSDRPCPDGDTAAAESIMFVRGLLDRMLMSAFDNLPQMSSPIRSRSAVHTTNHVRAELVPRLARMLHIDAALGLKVIPRSNQPPKLYGGYSKILRGDDSKSELKDDDNKLDLKDVHRREARLTRQQMWSTARRGELPNDRGSYGSLDQIRQAASF
jgi:ATP-dependent RNA helicase DHX36